MFIFQYNKQIFYLSFFISFFFVLLIDSNSITTNDFSNQEIGYAKNLKSLIGELLKKAENSRFSSESIYSEEIDQEYEDFEY